MTITNKTRKTLLTQMGMHNSSGAKSKSVTRGRHTTHGYSVYSVLLVLTRGRDVTHSVNTVSAGYRKFFLPPLAEHPCSG